MMKFTSRERILLIAMAVFFLGLGIFYGGRFIRRKLAGLDEKVGNIQKEKEEITRLGLEYQQLKLIPRQSAADESIDRYIESLVNSLNLAEKTTIKPSENSVEKKFIKRVVTLTISLSEARPVIDLIQRVETEKGNIYKIEYFSYRPTAKEGIYSFSIRVANFREAGAQDNGEKNQ